jgi:hypothetical protein
VLRTRPSITTFLSATALAITSSVAFTTPAHAAPRCSDYNEYRFGTPATDTRVSIRLCVEIINGKGYATAEGSWRDGGSPFQIDKFENFDISVRLERNQATYAGPGVVRDLTTEINYNDSGTFKNTMGPIYSPSGGSLPSGKWTTDGYVTYNINNDGEGSNTLSLPGSPSVTR